MTPNEYRKKYKRCATCEYWRQRALYRGLGYCRVTNLDKKDCRGVFCRIYKAKEFKE